ncbi:MAG: hypothetical protein EAZ89_21665, partial [Bacteroidetes bacterium]
SPFGDITKYRDMAVSVLEYALNVPFLKTFIPWASSVVSGLKSTDAVTKTLAEMRPDSDFLKELNNSPDPGVPYILIAGNTKHYTTTAKKKVDRVMDKSLVKVGEWFNHDTPNDIAVATASILNVPDTRNPAPVKAEVACHHMNYFYDSEGILKAKDYLPLTSV